MTRDCVALHVATRDGQLRPECVRGCAPIVDVEAGRLTVHVPRAQAARTLANLDDNRQVAVTITRLADYRTYQLKGRAVAWEEATESERPLIERYLADFARGADLEGLGDLARRWRLWPTVRVEVAVESVYNQ